MKLIGTDKQTNRQDHVLSQADALIKKHNDQPWSINGPYMVLQKDLVIFEILSGCFYLL